MSNNSETSKTVSSTNGTFSIATPAVTTILSSAGDMTDTSFLVPTPSYHQLGDATEDPFRAQSSGADRSEIGPDITSGQQDDSGPNKPIEETKDSGNDNPDAADGDISQHQTSGGETKTSKKRSKLSRKSAKLDAKSKLEKSRQSARECRARKKLRYQYLEDLVCNREKAVVKLREELTMFCDLSKKVDSGMIDEACKRLVMDQTIENSRNDSNDP